MIDHDNPPDLIWWVYLLNCERVEEEWLASINQMFTNLSFWVVCMRWNPHIAKKDEQWYFTIFNEHLLTNKLQLHFSLALNLIKYLIFLIYPVFYRLIKQFLLHSLDFLSDIQRISPYYWYDIWIFFFILTQNRFLLKCILFIDNGVFFGIF